MLKSPLRFPGGKSRAVSRILSLVPEFEEFREPMVGGGSVFLALRQRYPNRRYWINDLNYELYCFWKVAQECAHVLADALRRLREETPNGRELFYRLVERYGQGDEFERAVRFFTLNRITFSGTVDSGGYSEQAFHQRFTPSAIERVRRLEPLLQGVRITHGDYEPILRTEGEGVFVFLDPPLLLGDRVAPVRQARRAPPSLQSPSPCANAPRSAPPMAPYLRRLPVHSPTVRGLSASALGLAVRDEQLQATHRAPRTRAIYRQLSHPSTKRFRTALLLG